MGFFFFFSSLNANHLKIVKGREFIKGSSPAQWDGSG